MKHERIEMLRGGGPDQGVAWVLAFLQNLLEHFVVASVYPVRLRFRAIQRHLFGQYLLERLFRDNLVH